MKSYLCVLGRDPKLSIVELISYCKRKSISYDLKSYNSRVAEIMLSSPLNIKNLGGTTKIAEKAVMDALVPNKDKIAFSLTLIDSKDILPQLKELWKKEKIKAMQKYGSMRDIPPSKAQHLDLDIIVYRNDLYKVIALSNPKEYKTRDEARPSFDPLKVTSIRLAKILINLSEAKKEILDPFCGNGTILQEALLMGYEAKGIDVSISEAKKNIAWLGAAYQRKSTLLQGDAVKVLASLPKIEAVVTEPYMGPYHKKLPSEQEAKEIIKELEKLYISILSVLHAKIEGKAVIILPRIRTYTKTFSPDIPAILKKTGFVIDSPHPKIRLPLEYEKKRSKVERLIYILKKNKNFLNKQGQKNTFKIP